MGEGKENELNELNRENQWAFFKIEGFAGKRSLLSPPPLPSFHRFALAPFFTRDPNDSFARPKFRSLRTGTLATQANISKFRFVQDRKNT